jgi:hypothetical protein
MSMVENLRELKEKSVKQFLKSQEEKYEHPKCGDVISVHDGKCYACKHDDSASPICQGNSLPFFSKFFLDYQDGFLRKRLLFPFA